ncbi:MAG: MBL fold metallo-hydrolase [Clostridiales bacterium]|nr:MBL fold metallo-hydrolase [Clostridiales bacterium]
MRICNLGSGSDGNLTYIETLNSKVLLDVGLSCSEIIRRLSLLNVQPQEIDAILITHEHVDHIKGLDVFASKYHTKVYVHNKGLWAVKAKLKKSEQITFVPFDDLDFFIKDLKISNFPLSHDSEYCSGYTFLENTKKVSILTDLGYTNAEVLSKIQGSVLVYLEANHDIDMLNNNPSYPLQLKHRILGKRGHLSNLAAAQVIEQLAYTGTKQIMLSHLSRENNSPEIAYGTICAYLKERGIEEGKHIKIATTSIYPSYVFNIN